MAKKRPAPQKLCVECDKNVASAKKECCGKSNFKSLKTGEIIEVKTVSKSGTSRTKKTETPATNAQVQMIVKLTLAKLNGVVIAQPAKPRPTVEEYQTCASKDLKALQTLSKEWDSYEEYASVGKRTIERYKEQVAEAIKKNK